ncbi:MAG: hypothetical protein L0Y48_04580 [Fusobacteria bacterium]|nr:hypothetical protein [Fusobacteriota bacterium]
MKHFGLVSFILGGFSILLFCCCGGFILPLPSIIFGIISLVKNTDTKSRVFSILGIVFSIVAIILTGILLILWLSGAFNSNYNYTY